MSSPPVKIIIGIGSEIKTYTIPKDLLCYHSPYFRGCFNSGFKEGVEGELHSADENPEFFEVCLEYCRKGDAVYKPYDLAHQRDQLRNCIGFIKFCDKYDLGQVMGAVEGALGCLFECDVSEDLDPDDISQLGNCLSQESSISKLLMQACVRETIREDAMDKGMPFQRKFTALMRQDDAVAAGMMRELVVQKQVEKKWVFTCPPLLHWKALETWDELCTPASPYPTLMGQKERMKRMKENRVQSQHNAVYLSSIGL